MDQPMVVIVNPAAGGGRAARALPAIAQTLSRLGVAPEIHATRGPGDATELAREAAGQGFMRVIAVGGDGTLQEVANGLLAAADPPEFGVIPAGRGNDFARTLGIPTRTAEATRVACSATAVPIDVGNCNGRHFLNAGGVGFDGEVAAAVGRARHPWQKGKLAYLVTTLSELRRYRNRQLRIQMDGVSLERRVLLVAVANGRYYGGGMMICPGAEMTDGTFDICIVGDLSRREALGQLPGLFSGRHVRHPEVEIHRARSVTIDGGPETRAHLDGEPIGGPPLEFRVVAGALRVVVPGGARRS